MGKIVDDRPVLSLWSTYSVRPTPHSLTQSTIPTFLFSFYERLERERRSFLGASAAADGRTDEGRAIVSEKKHVRMREGGREGAWPARSGDQLAPGKPEKNPN